MYGKQVTVTHRTGSGPTAYGAVGATENAAAYYYVFDSSNASCNGTATDNDCYDVKIVGATSGPGGTDERQNFANWYSFYRTRNLMTVSATARAFNTVPGDDAGRLAVAQQLPRQHLQPGHRRLRGLGDDQPRFQQCHRAVHRGPKVRLLYLAVPAQDQDIDPAARCHGAGGRLFLQQWADSPYDNDIGGADDTEYSCRKNFHVMMTDGIWNTAVSGYGNYDSTTHGLPDGTSYTSRNPYQDSNSNSLADVAFKYWATDLRTDLDDNVPSYVTDFSGLTSDQYFNPKNDPSSWQHMVNFTVGLGLTPFLANTGLTWGGNTYAGSYTDILSGTKSWPTTSSSGVDGNVADLWHAAINSRGKFYSAEDPSALVTAFQEIVNTISTIAASGGGAGLSSNTTQIDQEGALIFEAKFNADWSGRLLARPVQTDGSLGTEYWDAGQLIPAPHARNIFTINADAEEFETCSGPLEAALDKDADGIDDGLCRERLNWLRGDGKITGATWASFNSGTVTATFTVTGHGFVTGDNVTVSDVVVSDNPAPAQGYNGAFVVTVVDTDTFTASVPSAATGLGTYFKGGRARYTQFRNRQASVLGDIMNSDPVYAFQDDFGYGGGASTVQGKDDYAAFVTGKDAQPPVIYVGANDGMLHGFQADIVASNSGVELLAYVPHGVYDNLSQLTDPDYTHKYFVDGPVSLGDAYIGGSWGTYLLGTLGAGGKSVFALDVSDPTNFTAADVKWEFSDASDLGLTYSKAQIAPTTESQWTAIFGNGYNSAGGLAYLYVVDLSNGNEIAKVGTNTDANNGLSTPYLYDGNGDKVVDVVYAGDLQGNLWKFVNTGGTWTLGNGGDPLFTAESATGDVQPITSQPKVATHPLGGVLVYFGTGSYLTYGDIGAVPPNDPGGQGFDEAQAFYAIWDNGTSGTVPRTALEGYSILTETTVFGFTVRTTSEGTVDWDTQRGWYLDLPATSGEPSERIVSTPLVLEFVDPTVPDRVLFVTNTPASDPCSRGGTTWLMELDLVTGGRTATSVFDLNGNGSFDTGDTVGDDHVPASGIALPPSYGITGEPLLLKTSGGNIIKEFSGSTGESGTAGGPLQQGEPPSAAGAPTRLYWKQIQ